MFCKYCGHQIPDDSVFCEKCGKSFSGKGNGYENDNEREKEHKETNGVENFLIS